MRLPSLPLHTLLMLLHLLLRRAWTVVTGGSKHGGRSRLRRLIHVGVIVAGRGGSAGHVRGACVAGAEHDLARSSLALIADEQHVVAGALQKLAEDIACRSGAVDAEDSLVGGESFDLCAGGGGNVVEDLLQAGVCGVDAQALTVPDDLGWGGVVVGWPERSRRFRRR